MTFRVGQKVVCINQPRESAKALFPGSQYPVKGGIYTIRQINEWPRAGVLLMFNELDNSSYIGKPIHGICYDIEPGFSARHFRPIVERKTSIEIFTAMLNPQKRSVDA